MGVGGRGCSPGWGLAPHVAPPPAMPLPRVPRGVGTWVGRGVQPLLPSPRGYPSTQQPPPGCTGHPWDPPSNAIGVLSRPSREMVSAGSQSRSTLIRQDRVAAATWLGRVRAGTRHVSTARAAPDPFLGRFGPCWPQTEGQPSPMASLPGPAPRPHRWAPHPREQPAPHSPQCQCSPQGGCPLPWGASGGVWHCILL